MKIHFACLCLSLTLLACATTAHAQHVNVTAFGAVPNDGISDTDQINAAVRSGTTVYFPPGIYNFSGTIDLPHHTSYRLYGDGPGVATIAFTKGAPYGGAGIAGVNIGGNSLTIEGLSLRADAFHSGRAIHASFNAAVWQPTATIRNVQIRGSSVTGGDGGFWGEGIYLHRAHNAVVEAVEINGNNRTWDPAAGVERSEWRTEFGIIWVSPEDYQTLNARMSNIEIHYCDTGVLTDGWVEDFEISNFEIVLSGQWGRPAMDLRTSSAGRRSNFRVLSGHLNALEHGIRLTRLSGATVSQVQVLKHGMNGFGINGDYLGVDQCNDIDLLENSFDGPAGDISVVEGIHLTSGTHSVRVKRNYFHNVWPADVGSCIVVRWGSHSIQIHDNLFDSVRNRYWDETGSSWYLDNN